MIFLLSDRDHLKAHRLKIRNIFYFPQKKHPLFRKNASLKTRLPAIIVSNAILQSDEFHLTAFITHDAGAVFAAMPDFHQIADQIIAHLVARLNI